LDRILRIFNVGVVRNQLDSWVELRCHLFRDECLGLFDVFLSEKELSVEIAQVYGIEINDVNLAEARFDEIFEKLAANAACANEKNARLGTLGHFYIINFQSLPPATFRVHVLGTVSEIYREAYCRYDGRCTLRGCA
jgi:hypothetical protein